MLLPLLEAIHDAGGIARPGELYDEVAKRMGLANEVRNLTVERPDRGKVNLFERRVRWARQTAIMKGLITTEQRGVWALTERANAKLHNIVRGAIVTLFETKNGIFIWVNAEDALGVIERGSIELLLSSPPYPLVKSKEGLSVWLAGFIKYFFQPRGYSLEGSVTYSGECSSDHGEIFVKGDAVEIVEDVEANEDPSWAPKPFVSHLVAKLIQSVVDSADSTGCDGDLTVCSKSAVDELAALIAPASATLPRSDPVSDTL
jgi:hypothetical protein